MTGMTYDSSRLHMAVDNPQASTMVPSLQDMRMLTMFVLTMTLAYYANHVDGMLFVATLLSILLTKQVVMQWWKGQLLTTKFFIRLGYLLLMLAGPLLVIMLLWTLLSPVYASAVDYIFDPFTGYYLMQWREILFIVAGLFIFYKAVSSLEFWRSADRQTLTGDFQSTMSENPDGFIAPSHAIAQQAGTSGRSKCRGRQRMTADLEIASTCSSGLFHAGRTAPVTRSQHRTFLLEKSGGVNAQFLPECRHPLHLCEPCQCRYPSSKGILATGGTHVLSIRGPCGKMASDP